MNVSRLSALRINHIYLQRSTSVIILFRKGVDLIEVIKESWRPYRESNQLLYRVPPLLFNFQHQLWLEKHENLTWGIPLESWTEHEDSRSLRLPEFLDNRHIKLVTLSVMRTGRLYPQEVYLVLISVRGWTDPRGQIKRISNCNDIKY